MNLLIENYPLLRKAIEAIVEDRMRPSSDFITFYIQDKLFDFLNFFDDMNPTPVEQMIMCKEMEKDVRNNIMFYLRHLSWENFRKKLYEYLKACMEYIDLCRKYKNKGD